MIAATACHYPPHADRPTWVVTVVRQRNGRDLVILAGPLMGAAEGTWEDGLLGVAWPTDHRVRYLNQAFFGVVRCEVDGRIWAILDRLYQEARAGLGA
jgi:hypothetical protein